MNSIYTKIVSIGLLIICSSSILEINAQNVGISNSTITPDASSILELRSTTGGFLMPRMSEVQKNAIASPATGLIIYQVNGVQGFYTYDGSAWVPFGEGVDNLGNHTASENLETDSNWISGDGEDEGIYIDGNGNVGLGTSSPEFSLDVDGPGLFRGGGTNLSTDGTQILLGYNGQDRYMQGIRTRHQSGQDAQNSIDFYTWDQGTDGISDEPTKRVMTIDGGGSGKVGIGTAYPQEELHITGSNDVELLLAADPDNINDAHHPKLKLSQDGGNVTGWFGFETEGANDNNVFVSNDWLNDAGDIRFRTRATTRMTLDGTGKLGLGTTNPAANLHIYGNSTSGFTPGFGGAGPEIGFARGGFYSGLAASIQLITTVTLVDCVLMCTEV